MSCRHCRKEARKAGGDVDKGTAGNGCATPSSLEKPAAVLEAILPQIKQLATAMTPTADKKTHMGIENDRDTAPGHAEI